MAHQNDNLSLQQGIALIQETTAARNLLAYGTRALRQAAFLDTTRDPVMTMLSIGVEKTMKMTLGLAHVAEHGEWPPRKMFKDHWRHDIAVMNAEILQTIEERLTLATNRGVVPPLLEKVRSNAAWGPIVAALHRYGAQGRFYYLDALAESPQTDDDPGAYWDAAERALLDSNPEFRTAFYAAASDPTEWDRRSTELNERMADAITDWWDLIAAAGIQRMLGERGAGWGHEVHQRAVGRQIR